MCSISWRPLSALSALYYHDDLRRKHLARQVKCALTRAGIGIRLLGAGAASEAPPTWAVLALVVAVSLGCWRSSISTPGERERPAAHQAVPVDLLLRWASRSTFQSLGYVIDVCAAGSRRA